MQSAYELGDVKAHGQSDSSAVARVTGYFGSLEAWPKIGGMADVGCQAPPEGLDEASSCPANYLHGNLARVEGGVAGFLEKHRFGFT